MEDSPRFSLKISDLPKQPPATEYKGNAKLGLIRFASTAGSSVRIVIPLTFPPHDPEAKPREMSLFADPKWLEAGFDARQLSEDDRQLYNINLGKLHTLLTVAGAADTDDVEEAFKSVEGKVVYAALTRQKNNQSMLQISYFAAAK